MYEQLVTRLIKSLGPDCVRCMEPMKKHTTFRIGGPVDVLIFAASLEELNTAIRICAEERIEVSVIGNGSNLLVSDLGIRGVIIALTSAQQLTYQVLPTEDTETRLLTVYAGTLLSSFAREVSKNGFAGMEWAAGIPGTIGGAVVMNAGAYGGETKDVLVCAEVLTKQGQRKTLSLNELDLSYRHSCIAEEELVVASATFCLRKGDAAECMAKIQELSLKRKEKQPLEFPSAGSTFKRPEGYFAGKLIQDAGLRGFCVGDACVSEKHAGFVINKGEATCVEVLELITEVRNRVFAREGVRLETEIRFLGDWSELPETVDRTIITREG